MLARQCRNQVPICPRCIAFPVKTRCSLTVRGGNPSCVQLLPALLEQQVATLDSSDGAASSCGNGKRRRAEADRPCARGWGNPWISQCMLTEHPVSWTMSHNFVLRRRALTLSRLASLRTFVDCVTSTNANGTVHDENSSSRKPC